MFARVIDMIRLDFLLILFSLTFSPLKCVVKIKNLSMGSNTENFQVFLKEN
jgi:hypothetical protein